VTIRFAVKGDSVSVDALALIEEIGIEDVTVQQNHFYDYRVMHMNDLPEIHVKLIPTDNYPPGVGQMPVTVVAPAVNNAAAWLTGTRLRESPRVGQMPVLTVIRVCRSAPARLTGVRAKRQ